MYFICIQKRDALNKGYSDQTMFSGLIVSLQFVTNILLPY